MSLWDVLLNAERDAKIIVSNPHCPRKPVMLARYLRLTAKEVAIKRGLMRPPAEENIGFTQHRIFKRNIDFAEQTCEGQINRIVNDNTNGTLKHN